MLWPFQKKEIDPANLQPFGEEEISLKPYQPEEVKL